MSKKKIHLLGAIFTMIVGTLLHFAYEWSGQMPIFAVFGAINESTWEHLKMLFWPFVFFSAFEYIIYGYKTENFISVKCSAVMVGMFAIVLSFYTYTGILGFNILPFDILIFVLGIAAAYYYSYYALNRQTNDISSSTKVLSLSCLVLLMLCFWVFTYTPPTIGLFIDPITKRYGL